jgi:hypothetical protein
MLMAFNELTSTVAMRGMTSSRLPELSRSFKETITLAATALDPLCHLHWAK